MIAETFQYMLLVSLYSTLLYFAMTWCVTKGNNFGLNRKLIIGSVLFSIALPFIKLPSNVIAETYGIQLEAIEISAQGFLQQLPNAGFSFNGIYLLMATLLIGFLLSISKLVYGIWKLNRIAKAGEKSVFQQHTIIRTSAIKQPCSFLQNIFIPIDQTYTDKELKLIVSHEQTHIKLNHSWDNILMGTLQSMFWWLPTMYFWNGLVKLNHEYEVDHLMIHQQDKHHYAQFLISQIYQYQKLLLVHTIYSFIKKRINMMYQKKENQTGKWVYFTFGLIICSMLFIQSCQKEKVTETKEKTEPAEVTFYEESVTDTVFVFNTDSNTEEQRIINSTRTIYKVPDNMPIIKECNTNSTDFEEKTNCSTQKLLQTLYKNLVYPAEGRESGTEGMLVCDFIISDKGALENPQIIRPLKGGFDEEVLRVLDIMKETLVWEPGKVDGKDVHVKYTLPVKFKLQ